MKKTILTIAVAISCAATGIYANETNNDLVANTEVTTKVEVSSFCKAIIKGDIETVQKLIELGEDVNKKSLGMTPSHFAARYNKPEILQLLINNGANLKTRCDKGYTVKKYAELSNAMDALEVLKSAMKG
ncbi:ankyrin repeat domain-containing protein [uncultured Croceitalea sp.]|uniref:ankyrin repeat domain-containing protein n=1 Tax=uncultured Croceitalea sp. TaxID=1798908 RepID=UPI003306268F